MKKDCFFFFCKLLSTIFVTVNKKWTTVLFYKTKTAQNANAQSKIIVQDKKKKKTKECKSKFLKYL